MRRRSRLAVAAGVLLLAACGRTPLYSELSEAQANEVQAALLAAHIDAGKTALPKGKGWSVSVADGDIPQAMAVLQSRGLPRQPQHTLEQVFPKEGFVSSPLEERARYIYALSQEVQQTLLQLDGVVDARVHIALPEQNVLEDKPPSASASVVVIETPGANLEARETDIKAIVVDGIEGLSDINRVTVKFFTRKAAALPDGASVAAGPLRSGAGLGLPLAVGGGAALLAVAGFAAWQLLRQRRPLGAGARAGG